MGWKRSDSIQCILPIVSMNSDFDSSANFTPGFTRVWTRVDFEWLMKLQQSDLYANRFPGISNLDEVETINIVANQIEAGPCKRVFVFAWLPPLHFNLTTLNGFL